MQFFLKLASRNKNKEVFPKRTDVIAGIKQIVLADDGVANSVIQEIIFRLAGHFIAQISAF